MIRKLELPDFDDPPVIETALGVEFAPMESWGVPHFGMFWGEIRGDFPKFQVLPSIGSQIEKFAVEARSVELPTVEILSQPLVRCWFIDHSDTRLIQIQNDRFIHNWRKVVGKEAYPHYETIRPAFEHEWQRFVRFLTSQKIEEPEVRQCEVTYVNHVERGKGWQSFADLANVISVWSGAESSQYLREPEMVALNLRYRIPDSEGRVHVLMQPAIRNNDAKEVLQLTLTARGRPRSSGTESMLEWFDINRERLGRTFVDFTTKQMHAAWKRKT